MSITLQQLSAYLPYDLQVLYTGILNGQEIKKYDKEFRATNPTNDDWAIKYKPIQPVMGDKIAKVKRLDIYNNYWIARIGIKTGGLKAFYNGNSFKPLLLPLSEANLTAKQTVIVGGKEYECTPADYIATSIKDSQRNVRFLLDGKADQLEQWKFDRLLQMHFDVYNLLGENLALDKTLYIKP